MALKGKYRFEDAFGKFRMGVAKCECCGKEDQMVVQYHDPQLPIPNVPWPPTLVLKKKRDPIGVTCGCYAKLHRQVAYIKRARSAKG